jgi:hypothetical protein
MHSEPNGIPRRRYVHEDRDKALSPATQLVASSSTFFFVRSHENAVMRENLVLPRTHPIRADCHDETETDRAVGQYRCLSG